MNNRTFTYQTRFLIEDKAEVILESYAALYGKVERTLFSDLIQGKDLNFLKKNYLVQYEITARQFNAIRIALEGKIDAAEQSRIRNIIDLKEKIGSLRKKLPKMRNKETRHAKSRKLHAMEDRLNKLELKKAQGKISLCFGGKKLFHAQYALEENGYNSHEEWKLDWTEARNSDFFCLGSKDETSGNQSCILTLDQEGNGSLKIRLPNALARIHGKYLTLSGVVFSYGWQEIKKALDSGQALSYRFKKDSKGWRVFISFKQEAAPVVTKSVLGAIGIDINANHIAAVEIDAQGNPIHKETIPLNTYGKTKNRAKALIGDVCKKIVSIAKEAKKPIILEKLDFTKKKASLKEMTPKQARGLSSFHYSQTLEGLQARAFKEGVEVYSVNTALTSIIGKIKYSYRYGYSVHHSAALCIARRYYKFSEALSKSPMKVVYKNIQVTCPVPARKRDQHVWKFWREAHRKLQTVLAAHFRARKGSLCPS